MTVDVPIKVIDTRLSQKADEFICVVKRLIGEKLPPKGFPFVKDSISYGVSTIEFTVFPKGWKKEKRKTNIDPDLGLIDDGVEIIEDVMEDGGITNNLSKIQGEIPLDRINAVYVSVKYTQDSKKNFSIFALVESSEGSYIGVSTNENTMTLPVNFLHTDRGGKNANQVQEQDIKHLELYINVLFQEIEHALNVPIVEIIENVRADVSNTDKKRKTHRGK